MPEFPRTALPPAGEGSHYNPPPRAGEGRVGGEAERRQLTVMFCDLVGSTPLSTRFDPEDLREIVGAYHRCVADTVARFGGFVAKYMGDGVLVYFGYPQAHEDDAERAARAGLAVIAAVGRLATQEPLNVRIGIATGLVVVGDLIGAGAAQERGVVGETPNLAVSFETMLGLASHHHPTSYWDIVGRDNPRKGVPTVRRQPRRRRTATGMRADRSRPPEKVEPSPGSHGPGPLPGCLGADIRARCYGNPRPVPFSWCRRRSPAAVRPKRWSLGC